MPRIPKFQTLTFLMAALAPIATPLSAGPATNAKALSEVRTFEVTGLDSSALLLQAEANEGLGDPYQFAEPVETNIDPGVSGTWETLPDGDELWRLVVVSKGALSVNLGFSAFRLTENATMHLYTPDGKTVFGPFTAADNENHGKFWSPVLPGDTAVVEVRLPAGEKGDLDLVLGSVNHGFRGLRVPKIAKSGSCNFDVACEESCGWEDEVRSVGVYSIGGTFACTGSLVNNTANDRRGFFLTADHCGIGSGNAASVVIYWNYQNSTCRTPGGPESGGVGDGPLDTFNSGTIFRAGHSVSDFTLVELDDPLPSGANAFFAGWDRRNYSPPGAVGIHHPGTDEKRISFEFDPVTITSRQGTSVPGDSTHLRVADWDLGTTEGGSSGSPLFDIETKRIVGQLYGGFAACGNDLADWYGRVWKSWTGNNTNSTRLSNWLDPGSTGAEFVDGITQFPLMLSGVATVNDGSPGGDGDGDIEPGESEIALFVELANSGATPITITGATLSSKTDGVTVSSPNGTYPAVPAGGTATNTIPFAFDVAAFVECGSTIQFDVELAWTGGGATYQLCLTTGPLCDPVPLFMPTGSVGIDDSTGNGNSTGGIDPGESRVFLSIEVTNSGASATEIAGTLSSMTPGVTIVQGMSAYPDLAMSATGSNATPFAIAVSDQHPCGTPILLELGLQPSGIGAATFPIVLQTGLPSGTDTFQANISSSGAILDLQTLIRTIDVPAQGPVIDVNATVDVDHTYMEDLTITLTGPGGESSLLISGRGGSGNDMNNTVFDDSAGTPIGNGTPPFAGTFRPESPLSAFNGTSASGTWTFSTYDSAQQDQGTMTTGTGISIQYQTRECTEPLDVSGPTEWRIY